MKPLYTATGSIKISEILPHDTYTALRRRPVFIRDANKNTPVITLANMLIYA